MIQLMGGPYDGKIISGEPSYSGQVLELVHPADIEPIDIPPCGRPPVLPKPMRIIQYRVMEDTGKAWYIP